MRLNVWFVWLKFPGKMSVGMIHIIWLMRHYASTWMLIPDIVPETNLKVPWKSGKLLKSREIKPRYLIKSLVQKKLLYHHSPMG
jgi:hypothetical protein